MSGRRAELASLATQLRAEFDHAFAQPHPPELPPQQDLLVIRVAEHEYAVDLEQVASLQADRKIVPLPSPHAKLLGLVGMRGSVLPVYDLRQLLGYPRGLTSPRWVLSVRAPAPFALAFELLEAHLRLPKVDVESEHSGVPSAAALIRGSVATATGPRPLLDLMAIFTVVTASDRRVDQPAPEGTL